jgi:transcriptional regulator with XRE-family HTH domain
MSLFQKNLKYCRKRFGISQEELALQVKRGQSTVGGWENNVSEPNIDNLIMISDFFGVRIDELLRVDIEQGKLITELMVSEFKHNGKVSWKGIGKLMTGKQVNYTPSKHPVSVINEGEQSMIWVVMRKLEEIKESVDKLHVSGLNTRKKQGK